MNRKTTIISLISIVFAVVLWYILKKVSGASQLDFDFGDINIDIHSFSDMLKFIISSRDASVDAIIMNFGKEKYVIDNINIYLYSKSGVVIGYQKQPITKIVIQPNQNNHIVLPMVFKGTMLLQLGKQLDITSSMDLWALVQNYLYTGKFGTSILIKGYMVVKGIKIPVNFEKNI